MDGVSPNTQVVFLISGRLLDSLPAPLTPSLLRRSISLLSFSPLHRSPSPLLTNPTQTGICEQQRPSKIQSPSPSPSLPDSLPVKLLHGDSSRLSGAINTYTYTELVKVGRFINNDQELQLALLD